jgi:hypothetical protein
MRSPNLIMSVRSAAGIQEAVSAPERLRSSSAVAAAVRDQPHVTLFTRAKKEHAAAIWRSCRELHDQDAHLLAWPAKIPDATGARGGTCRNLLICRSPRRRSSQPAFGTAHRADRRRRGVAGLH